MIIKMKILYVVLFFIFMVPVSISIVHAQTLYVDATVGDMDDIDESKYRASGVSVTRNESGELISVARVDATRYLNDPIVDEFLDSIPTNLVKKGILDDKEVSLYRFEAAYNLPECLEILFDVPGYNNECDWYHRAFVTMLKVNKDDGDSIEGYTIFRGLNHAFIVKPLDVVTTYWNIISKN